MKTIAIKLSLKNDTLFTQNSWQNFEREYEPNIFNDCCTSSKLNSLEKLKNA